MKPGMKNFLNVALAAAFIWAAGEMHGGLNRRRAKLRIVPEASLEYAPPLVTFTTVALGGFNGLLADLLWLRAVYLQDAGKFIELVQLSDWITKLEPDVTEIWEFHAWNIAYNVSVMMPEPEQRWRWVKTGIDLLRDDGLRFNPSDPKIYWSIGWLFQNKVGTFMDSASIYYRTRLAEEMRPLTGTGPVDYAAVEGNTVLRRRLAVECGLRTDLMREIDREFGPLDWTAPEAHAVYWAYRAKQHAPGGIFIPAERMIYQSLGMVFRHGKFSVDVQGRVSLRPNTAMLGSVMKAYESSLKVTNDESIRLSYVGFLKESVAVLHMERDDTEAKRIYGILKERFGKDVQETWEQLIAPERLSNPQPAIPLHEHGNDCKH